MESRTPGDSPPPPVQHDEKHNVVNGDDIANNLPSSLLAYQRTALPKPFLHTLLQICTLSL